MTQQIESKSNGSQEKVADTILLVPLTDIYIDANWNARSGNWQEDPESTDSPDGGFQGLLESLKVSKTNQTPIELRPNHDPKTSAKFKYLLVAGFRRCKCAQLLGWTHLRATVKEMSDLEARIRNIQEGTAHSNLKTADLAWAIGDLKEKGGQKLKDKDIANILGLSESYVSILRRIQTDVKPAVTKAWRDSGLKVSVSDMQRLTVIPKEDQEKEWQKVTEGRNSDPGGNGKKTPYQKLKEKVVAKGFELGKLAQLKCVTLNVKGDWDVAIQEIFHVPSAVNAQQLVKLSAALADAYKEGLEAKLKTAEDESEESEES